MFRCLALSKTFFRHLSCCSSVSPHMRSSTSSILSMFRNTSDMVLRKISWDDDIVQSVDIWTCSDQRVCYKCITWHWMGLALLATIQSWYLVLRIIWHSNDYFFNSARQVRFTLLLYSGHMGPYKFLGCHNATRFSAIYLVHRFFDFFNYI